MARLMLLLALLLPPRAWSVASPALAPHRVPLLSPPPLSFSRVQSLRGGTVMASSAPLLTALEPAVLGASLRSMTELITCCGLGAIATRAGLIDRDTTRALARCVFNIFLPAMLFTSVASTVASGAGWWTLAPVTLAAALQGEIDGPQCVAALKARLPGSWNATHVNCGTSHLIVFVRSSAIQVTMVFAFPCIFPGS